MIVNKHGSFYLRTGWGTKIIQAVDSDNYIFSPNNEQMAVDNIGLGRVMIKALRYWSTVMGLTTEEKSKDGINQVPTSLFKLIKENDLYFQKRGSLLLTHRNMAINIENATAWYWAFNEYKGTSFCKENFVEAFHSYLAVNHMNIKKEAVEKEYNCFKNTYIGEKNFDLKNILDDDTFPFFAPLHLFKINEDKCMEKVMLSKKDIPLSVLVYSIAKDNQNESTDHKQVSIDKIMEDKFQVGRYFNIRYSKIIELLIEAENKHLITLSNNFGNRYIEFLDLDYDELICKYYKSGER